MTKKEESKTIALLVSLPVVFALTTIFITYRNINIFLVSGLILVILEFIFWAKLTKKMPNIKQKLAYLMPMILILVGSIGISASTTLTREKIELIKDPERVSSCSINPVVACSPVINSQEASAFGSLPNPLIGIFSFGAFLVAGMSILAGGKFASWWWKFLWLGSALGLAFSLWLAYQTIYDIGALCIYCMVVWSITIPTFFYVSLYNFEQKHFKIPNKYLDIFEKNHMVPTILVYSALIIMIYFRFSDYWNTLI